MKNPFNPTFGDVPALFLDKEQQVTKLVSLIQQSDFARSFSLPASVVQVKLPFSPALAMNSKQIQTATQSIS